MRRLVLALIVAALATTACDSSDGNYSPGQPMPTPTAVVAPAGDSGSFLGFAEGGEAPHFDDQVDVSVGDSVVLTLTRDQARDPQAWVTDDGSLLAGVSNWRAETPSSCRGLPSPTGPLLRHDVDARGVEVLWRPRVCDFAVRLLIDRDNEIAAVAFDVP